MGDLYVFTPGGGDEWEAKRAADRDALRAIRERWITAAGESSNVAADAVRAVVAALFDHEQGGEKCLCSCHPRFATLHDGGFDCPCTLTDEERTARWEHFFEPSPWREELRLAHEREQREIQRYLANEPGVRAERTCTMAPEVWEGTIDGRTFFFRERHGEWRIEIDLVPDGHIAQRYVGTGADGEMITEPVELTSGPVIAEGFEGQLGDTAVDHLAFIVRTVRGFIRGESCLHPLARAFCADCGAAMDVPPAGDWS